MAYLAGRSRDHARTPMPWEATNQAGFTTGQPWIRLNPEYPAVNVAAQLKNGGSVLEHYRRLIQLRRTHEVFVDGDFEELGAPSERIGGYRRRLGDTVATVWCNFTALPVLLPEAVEGSIILDPSGYFDGRMLAPWQSIVAIK